MAAQSPRITEISVEGFKSIRDKVTVPIRPLTVLAGQNSAGKSTLMQPLLLLKQTIESSFPSDPLLLNGPCVKIVDAASMFWRGADAQTASQISISVRSTSTSVDVDYALNGKLRVSRTCIRSEQYDLELHASTTSEQLAKMLPERGYGPNDVRFDVVTRNGAFSVDGTQLRQNGQENFRFPVVSGIGPSFAKTLIHLPGLRGTAERVYSIAGISKHFPGTFVPYVSSILLDWAEAGDAEKKIAAVGLALEQLGLTWRVQPVRRNDAEVELRVGRRNHRRADDEQDLVSIADVGFGTSQVLPVVVALEAAEEGQLVHIEQPELHLHPNAQVHMVKLLINAAKRGVGVVVETHSSMMLKAIQLAVARGEISPDDVSLNWFTRDEDGATKVTTAELDKAGAYGDWPVDFASRELELDQAYIDAAFARMDE